jgi:hypothetical protein
MHIKPRNFVSLSITDSVNAYSTPKIDSGNGMGNSKEKHAIWEPMFGHLIIQMVIPEKESYKKEQVFSSDNSFEFTFMLVL